MNNIKYSEILNHMKYLLLCGNYCCQHCSKRSVSVLFTDDFTQLKIEDLYCKKCADDNELSKLCTYQLVYCRCLNVNRLKYSNYHCAYCFGKLGKKRYMLERMGFFICNECAKDVPCKKYEVNL